MVIDPGHGGKDRTNKGPTGYIEADGTLAMALAAREVLWAAGVTVRMIREEDKTVELYTRPYLANEWGADLFISIHTNAAADPSAQGIETYYSLNGEWGSDFYPEAHELAIEVQQRLVETTGFKDRGIKTRLVSREDSPIKGMDYYAVIRRTKCPAIIAEVGFHTNPGEEANLKDAAFLKKAGEAIAMGILGYIGMQPAQPVATPVVRQPRLVVDGVEVQGSAKLEDGKLWLWSRGLVEAMGARVDWDAATLTAYVDTGKHKMLPAFHPREGYSVITAAPEHLEVKLVKGLLPVSRSGINGGFLDGQLNPLGVVVISGLTIAERVMRVPPRPVFWLRGGIAGISIVGDIAELGGVDFAIGGGPSLLPKLDAEAGDYQADIMTSTRERTAVGITAEGLVKLITTPPLKIAALGALMHSEGCRQAMALDGGGSTTMIWGGRVVQGNARANCTALLIKEGL